MKKALFLFSLLFVAGFCSAQTTVQEKVKIQKDFNKKLNKLLSLKVPFISVSELDKNFSEYTILDSREEEEYLVGHIEGAKCIGYDDFEIKSVSGIDKESKIAVYCSIGYRSEKITKKLREAGYTNAVNVYGSIFQWVNEDKPIYNSEGDKVDVVHTYNRKWSKWVFSEKIRKTW